MDVELLKKTRVGRTLRLSASSGEYTVEYNGYGVGGESVLVDGAVVAKERSWVKMVPRFEFPIGPHAGVIRIETKLWRDLLGPLIGRLESFVLEVDSEWSIRTANRGPGDYSSEPTKEHNSSKHRR